MARLRLQRRTRFLRKLHRWAGVGSALFLLWLSLTGLLLNHSDSLGLDRSAIVVPWLLNRYGVPTPRVEPVFVADAVQISFVEGRLYVGARSVVEGLATPIGAVAVADSIVVADGDSLIVLNREGEIVDARDAATVLPARIEALGSVGSVGSAGSGVAVSTSAGDFLLDSDTFEMEPLDGVEEPIEWSETTTADPAIVAAILADYRGSGISYQRLLLDLHSGRFAGVGGSLLMDMAALALVFLGISGLVIWWRR